MRLASAVWRRSTALRPNTPSQVRHLISDARPFREGDLVLLRNTKDRGAPPILSRPLKFGKRIESHKGTLFHDDIIGKRVRDVVATKTTKSNKAATEFRIHELTLEDYCRLTKRFVTPIYAADANLIVSLLDLHPANTEGSAVDGHRLEILEAGTGHGALTLHLSRAIHAANGLLRETESPTVADGSSLEKRQAILHSIEISPKFSEHARDVVRGFRHGIYAQNVDFHVGNVSEWVKKASSDRDTRQFLSHAFLDLPMAERHLGAVADALRTDGTLIVFKPSITQIMTCATKVKDGGIPLDLESVIELGNNGGSGGREWDVRFVRPRASDKKADSEEEVLAKVEFSEERQDVDEAVEPASDESSPTSPHEGSPWSLVCRPKVGERITGGGFLGVWKKKRGVTDKTLD